MSPKIQRQIMSDFFSDKGIELSMARTTIAGSDFSTRQYTYDDHDWDWDLKQWSLVEEDTKYRIPQMKIASEVAKHKPIKYFGSPWSGPAWLKTNHKITGKGQLLEKAGSKPWETYANYIVKWLSAYKEHGVEFWGMTVQNEPMTGMQENFPWNTMGFTAEMERDFLKTDLGPALERAGWGPDKFNVMILDHNRDLLPQWADVVLGDSGAAKYAKGVAVHWYGNGAAGPERYDQVHNNHPNHFILATEACNGWQDADWSISLGRWDFGESYAHDIIRDLTHWVSGWNDWNAVLDMTGGPIWVGKGHYESAPIIVDPAKGEYFKNPMFFGNRVKRFKEGGPSFA
ncbi:unnamed protein product [Medioppia subpectinata]|uniref:Glucosylceramidase n=1 Tax=Medioppia subpectinata TaxID=1979941 RepID=A0A7R9KBV4_9ACAR|nr:unnamed protein product [Medioppia subpectinata]CAG2100447.1 unnamed protein product [Medioppia subpectinata]